MVTKCYCVKGKPRIWDTTVFLLLRKLPDPFFGLSSRTLPFSHILILGYKHKVTLVRLPCGHSVVASQCQSLNSCLDGLLRLCRRNHDKKNISKHISGSLHNKELV